MRLSRAPVAKALQPNRLAMNPFVVLDLPERASLNTEEVKVRFQELSRTHHPDQQSNGSDDSKQFAEINQAYQALSTAGGRLKALLQSRYGKAFELKGTLPEGLLDLFTIVGSTLQSADGFLAKKSKATTMLAEALLAPKLLTTQQALGKAMHTVNERLDEAESKLPALEASLDLQEASALCREFLYLEKWQGQIQARFHELI